MNKTLRSAVMAAALPLFLCVFAFYEYFSEVKSLQEVKARALSGMVQSLQYVSKGHEYELLLQHEVGDEKIYISEEVMSDSVADMALAQIPGTTVTVGYADGKRKMLMYLVNSKNDSLVSLTDYKIGTKKEIAGGPLAAGIVFGGLSILMFSMAWLIPIAEAGYWRKLDKSFSEIPGMAKVDSTTYRMQMLGKDILIMPHIEIAMSKYPNKSYLKVLLPANAEGNSDSKHKTEFFNGLPYHITTLPYRGRLNPESFLRSIEEAVVGES